jgi:hypothetical protein
VPAALASGGWLQGLNAGRRCSSICCVLVCWQVLGHWVVCGCCHLAQQLQTNLQDKQATDLASEFDIRRAQARYATQHW